MKFPHCEFRPNFILIFYKIIYFQIIWELAHYLLPLCHPPQGVYQPLWPLQRGGRSQPWVNLWPHRGTCYPKVPCPYLASPQTAWYPTPTQTATTITPAAPITMPQCPLGDPTMGISMDPLATLAPEWPLGVNPTTGINTKKFAPAGGKTALAGEKLPQLGKKLPHQDSSAKWMQPNFSCIVCWHTEYKERNLKWICKYLELPLHSVEIYTFFCPYVFT